MSVRDPGAHDARAAGIKVDQSRRACPLERFACALEGILHAEAPSDVGETVTREDNRDLGQPTEVTRRPGEVHQRLRRRAVRFSALSAMPASTPAATRASITPEVVAALTPAVKLARPIFAACAGMLRITSI